MDSALPEQLTDHVSVFGNEDFRHYLVGSNGAVLVECGVTASVRQFIAQLDGMDGPAPEKLVAMHAHFDHVCGIPALRRRFPAAEVLASSAAAKVLDNPKIMAGFFDQDRQVAYPEGPAPGASVDRAASPERIGVDRTVQGGDRIGLPGGESLEVIDAPGHSPCSLAVWFEKERVLFVSDALGFQISDTTIFPVFFYAYRPYIETIERLAACPAEVLAFPHGRIWRGPDVPMVFQRALSAARDVRDEIVMETGRGRDAAELRQMLFDRFYREQLRLYTPENIRLCVDLLVRRSLEDR